MPGALSHIRVLDLSRILAGPWAGQALADMGAEVIKVERPGSGDDTRGWGPPFLGGADGAAGVASYFLSANRNKQSLTIDIATAAGQELVRELARRSDVLLENYKVDGLRQYGLDYEALRAINPQLVYCSITGFGQTGPYAPRAGYDFLIQGLGGLMSLTGVPDGEPGAGPVKTGVALTDILTGLYATSAILAALAWRDRDGLRRGEGQHIDLALLDVQVACLANQASAYLATGQAPERMGNAHPSIVPYQAFPTRDGHMILAIGNDGQFARFCACAGLTGLAADPRFSSNRARVAHRAELIPLLAACTVGRSTADWIALLESQAVPCGPINSVAEVFADPQVQARGMRIDLPHAGVAAGQVALAASPIKFSATPVAYRQAPPGLGEHTDSVLERVLGLDQEARDALRAAHVI